MHPAIRLIQAALPSLGYDAGPVDGFWGPSSAAAAAALFASGPIKSTEWAVTTLQRGLAGLGYLVDPDGEYGPKTQAQLGALIDAEGQPRASVADPGQILQPTKPELHRPDHGRVMRQGSAGHVVDTLCFHCGALPGDWHVSKSNAGMLEELRWMHVAPPAQGGRGWSDLGYHAVGFPDGEVLEGRPWDRIGAGAIGHNRGVFHLLMVEVRTITGTALPESYFTPETLASAKAQIAEIGAATPLHRLMGHREVAAKLCPGFEVIDRDWTDLAVA